MERTRQNSQMWVATGTQLCQQVIASFDERSVTESSHLPGWNRAQVIAHIDGNARGLANLVTWARTGIETPMYTSMEQRDADIEAGALLPLSALRERFLQSSHDLDAGFDSLSEQTWLNQVRTAQGRIIAAEDIPWLRAREVMIHAVDLGGNVTFDDLPDDFLIALVNDVVARRQTLPGHPSVVLHASANDWEIIGEGTPMTVEGTTSQIAAYVTGRKSGAPELPPWL
jgi:maleylpyruvate isomerase